jgi:hypothetical protein
MIRRPAGRLGIDPAKPKLPQIEFLDKDLNHPNRVGSSFRRTPPSAIVHAVPEFIWAISV